MVTSFKKIYWTEHSKIKMRQYSLSKIKILNLLHKPERVEQGIVPGTIALMRTNPAKFANAHRGASQNINNLKLPIRASFGKWQKITPKIKKAPGEVWIMYKDVKDSRKIISVWRYPGVTKPGEQIPVPQDIRNYIENSREFN
jgi:hypothetical protein